MESFVDLRRLGSAALEICAVADGSLDAYREDDLAVYDWAAAMLIAEEAGAVVHRPDSRSSVVAVNLDPRDGPAHTAPEPSA
jgi:myo-inositol-1(or 4)-monophosphatase